MTILGAVAILIAFVLGFWIIYWLPLPPAPATPVFVKPLLYIVLAIIAIVVVLHVGGVLDGGLNTRIR